MEFNITPEMEAVKAQGVQVRKAMADKVVAVLCPDASDQTKEDVKHEVLQMYGSVMVSLMQMCSHLTHEVNPTGLDANLDVDIATLLLESGLAEMPAARKTVTLAKEAKLN